MLVYQMFLSFCVLMNVFRSKSLHKSPLKFTHPVVLQLADYFVMAFSMGSQVRSDIQVSGDSKRFI